VEAVKQEIVQRKNYFGGEEVHTVYYGGGTPTILSGNDLESIHQTVLEHFPVEKYAEITMEANPDDLTIAKLKFLKQLGVVCEQGKRDQCGNDPTNRTESLKQIPGHESNTRVKLSFGRAATGCDEMWLNHNAD